MNASWYRRDETGDRLRLTLHVQPNAARTEVAGLHGDALKLRVAAPAVENQANARLIGFLSKMFEVPASRVEVKHGSQGRRKIVEIAGSRLGPEILLRNP